MTAVGILQSRQGAGTFVVERDESPTLDSSPLRMMAALHGFTSDEMFEARLALEMSIAGLAAVRATPEAYKAFIPEELRNRAFEDGLVVQALEQWASNEAARILVGVFLVAAAVMAVAAVPALGLRAGREDAPASLPPG